MKQFGKIFNFELKYYMKNKIFVGVTVFLVLLIAVVMFIPTITASFESDGSDTPTADLPIMLVRADPTIASSVQATFAAAFPEYSVMATDEDVESIKSKISSNEVECAFVIDDLLSFTYYVNNLSIYDMNSDTAYGVMQSVYQMNAMIEGGLTPEEVGSIMSVQIEGRTESLGKDQMQNFFYTYIMIFALYMVILLYGQMVATNVATEKSSRAMEVLVTSASPTAMMFGKVIASCLAGLIQLVAVFGSAILFYNINKDSWGDNPIIASIFNMPVELFGYMLVFFVLGFLIYAFMFGAVGSTASKLEDINTSVMPITLLFVIGFVVVVMSFTSGEVDNLLMQICSYVPFTSSMAMFTRIAMGSVAWYEIVISIAVLIGSTVGIGVISAKIYRVGVLLYGTPPKLSAIIKAVRRA